MRKIFFSFLGICCILLIAACAKNDTPQTEITGPENDKETSLQLSILKGNNQIALPGALLYDTLMVKLTDKENKPVSGKTIGFKASNANVTLLTTDAISDNQGIVRSQIALGNVTAGEYKDIVTVFLKSNEKIKAEFSFKVETETEVDVWLNKNPRIAETISWPESNSSDLNYNAWTATQKTALNHFYQQAKATWEKEVFALSPPVNQNTGASTTIKLDRRDVWPIYLSNIAVSLHSEMNNLLNWSILDYDQGELKMLLDGRTFFIPDAAASNLYQLNGASTARRIIPESALFLRSFLQKEKIIQSDKISTIGSLLDWCHQHFTHFGGSYNYDNILDHWQYSGGVPMSRLINGTTRISDNRFNHYTAGCHGTVDFIKLVLRSSNIPVESFRSYDSHRQAYFSTEGLYMSHGDDPYNLHTWVTPVVSLRETLIDQPTYDRWFNGSSKESVARGTVEFAVKHLSNILVNLRASEPAGTPPAQSKVLKEMSSFFTLEELLEMDLWTRLDARISSLGGRDRIPEALIGRYK
ncbi:Ig-like domain-containing protein [Sphingobacterium faecale]|uniref:Ig-like domain-containing protein n=1 Tax=Sphingobacterium faecale TaxID=2803775 RepID=A0ABS1R9R3_9SPHI|nr:Ig-like domain-containing protein [Sphingobacterium faecale]MBL1411436.1 Ig-like domain-containing protein [Sphingobacterium faecale]